VAQTSATSPKHEWRHHPLVHTIEVGLISAALVLGVLGAVLLALAIWLP
jgi:hypothetical protein